VAAEQGKKVWFRADAAFAKPDIYEALKEHGAKYTIRIPANDYLLRDIAELLIRPVGRPTHKPVVWYKDFLYRAASWTTVRRVVAKVEFHAGELFPPRLGFIVTNTQLANRKVVHFYNQRGKAEHWSCNFPHERYISLKPGSKKEIPVNACIPAHIAIEYVHV
jgi:hypothetical protein